MLFNEKIHYGEKVIKWCMSNHEATDDNIISGYAYIFFKGIKFPGYVVLLFLQEVRRQAPKIQFKIISFLGVLSYLRKTSKVIRFNFRILECFWDLGPNISFT